MDMTRCPKCCTYHYGNDPCPDDPGPEYVRFDADSYCVVYLRCTDTVRVCTGLAGEAAAKEYARQVELDGGHVFAAVPAGVLVAALQLIRKEKRRP